MIRPAAARILVIRLGAMGDVVRTLPAVSALRRGYEEAHLTWLVEPGSNSVLEGQPWIERVLVFPRPTLAAKLRQGRWISAWRELARFLRELRAGDYDLVVDFHSILRSGLLSLASGGALRVAYARPYGREGGWLAAHRRARLSAPKASRFERNLALVRFLGVEEAPDAEPLRVESQLRVRIEHELGAGSAPVAIHPGTSDDTPHKRWTVAGYAELARRLRDEAGLHSVVTVGPARDDRRVADAIVSQSDGAARLAPSTGSLKELAALFARCALYVGSDTGPMHLASLMGTPVVQILGPTDPVENAPYPCAPSRTVRVPLACAPCGRRGCSAATCMRVIEVDSVLGAARELLATAEHPCSLNLPE